MTTTQQRCPPSTARGTTPPRCSTATTTIKKRAACTSPPPPPLPPPPVRAASVSLCPPFRMKKEKGTRRNRESHVRTVVSWSTWSWGGRKRPLCVMRWRWQRHHRRRLPRLSYSEGENSSSGRRDGRCCRRRTRGFGGWSLRSKTVLMLSLLLSLREPVLFDREGES